jgi:hypothetical protein
MRLLLTPVIAALLCCSHAPVCAATPLPAVTAKPRATESKNTRIGVQVKIETFRVEDAIAIRDAGFTFVRFGVWADRMHDYAYQRQVASAFDAAKRVDLPVLVTIRSTQPLIVNLQDPTQRNTALNAAGLRFAANVEQIQREFASQILAVELWNEPDLDKYWPTGAVSVTFSAFMRGVCASPGLHHGHVPIVGFGFSRAPRPGSLPDALLRSVTRDGSPCLDAVSYHAYGMSVDAIREVARDVKARYGVPAIITEWGAPSGVAPGGTLAQARRVQTFVLALSHMETPLVSVYEWKDTRSGVNARERSFGLVDATGVPKPVLPVVRDALRRQPSSPADDIRVLRR